MKKFITVFFIVFTQIIIYFSFIEPKISTWNASNQEINTKLVGDDIALSIASTRAIDIAVSKQNLWEYLVLLGADRSGFYAYTFLEELLGYKTKKQNTLTKNQTISLDRIVPTTVNGNDKLNFAVVAVKQNEYFVLKGWGTFLLKELDSNNTRLIIRTHTQDFSTLGNLLFNPMHYIMERRMMLGLKANAENNKQNLVLYDMAYLFGVVFSAFAILVLIFTRRGLFSVALAFIYSNIWLYTLLVFNPLSFYSLVLFLVVLGTNFLLKKPEQKGNI